MSWFQNWFGGEAPPVVGDVYVEDRIIVPDTEAHRKVVDKLAFSRPGQFIFLTDEEFKLLDDIRIWPPRSD